MKLELNIKKLVEEKVEVELPLFFIKNMRQLYFKDESFYSNYHLIKYSLNSDLSIQIKSIEFDLTKTEEIYMKISQSNHSENIELINDLSSSKTGKHVSQITRESYVYIIASLLSGKLPNPVSIETIK